MATERLWDIRRYDHPGRRITLRAAARVTCPNASDLRGEGDGYSGARLRSSVQAMALGCEVNGSACDQIARLTPSEAITSRVEAGLVPAIHVFRSDSIFKKYMPATRTGMTIQHKPKLL
jgi:hypothetical protein